MADPKTCWHNVVVQDEPRECHCASCGTRITAEINARKNYQYDDEHDCWVHDPEVSPHGGLERRMGWHDQPRASETTLGILRARLTGGDIDGLYIKLAGTWVKAEDAFDHCYVMRDGEWVKADNPAIERWLLSITNGG